ncbi:MAG TPA: DCC1-like thiol-disulfide oxidoreductase family protein [Hyphomicrobiaceae bacterium]|nr:DCC1-like thiol-disulfide oxidoreductase family protein [Hyphomicrobiaceae bacterium]
MSDRPKGIQIVYDGQCPFCTSYVRLVRLRKAVGQVDLINARDPHPLVDEIVAAGLDLNEGMAAKYEGRLYHGHECVHLLSTLSEPEGMSSGLLKRLFASKGRTRLLYPYMRGGRDIVLRILGRTQI